jgi:RNA polymerase sigma-70 factor (ECF subfamily)
VNSPVDTFEAQRGRMFGIAYRMLGSASEAEDIVQDAWLRWQAADRSDVEEPGAFLATIVTRLSLTALDSARARREVYVGPWLPEPVSTADDPTLGAERAEAMSLAVLLLLERLTPAERAAYVLHEAFGYQFARIAEVLETSEANARKLASRARQHLDRERGVTVSAAERDRLLAAFVAAARAGDLEQLETLLAEDVAAISDGGGVISAARRPVVGRTKVAAFLLGIVEKFAGDVAPYALVANGEVGIVVSRKDGLRGFVTIDVGPAGIRNILLVMNPSKLAALA